MFGVNVEYVVGFGANLILQGNPCCSASLVVHQVGYVVPKDQFERIARLGGWWRPVVAPQVLNDSGERFSLRRGCAPQ